MNVLAQSISVEFVPIKFQLTSPSIHTGVSAAGVKFLLDYVYTSKLALSLANVQDVLSAASHLQVKSRTGFLKIAGSGLQVA